MLMRTDPFRDFDRLAQQVLGTRSVPAAMPLAAYRDGGDFLVQFDLPGVDPGSIDLNVERNVLTVRAERSTTLPENAEIVADERTLGSFTRQVFLGDTLDTENIQANYENGVL